MPPRNTDKNRSTGNYLESVRKRSSGFPVNYRIMLLVFLILMSSLSAVRSGDAYAQNDPDAGNFSFGIVLTGSEINHAFEISNESDKALAIKSVAPSCESLQILAYPEIIPPHGTGHLELRVVTFKPQIVDCEAVVETDDQKHTWKYRVNGRIEGQAVAKSRELMELPGQLFTRKLMQHSSALYLAPESLMRKLKKEESLALIDIRPAQEFEKFRIPDSINLPLFALKTKEFLKLRTLILINEGHSYKDLEREAQALKQTGFKVFILDGGLNLWRKKGGTLSGDMFAQEGLKWFSPYDFFTEKDYGHWLVVDASRSEESSRQFIMPQAVRLALSDAKGFVAGLKAEMKKSRQDRFLLLIADNEKDYEKAEELAEEAGIDCVFCLRGGMNGYKSFLQQQAAIWKAKSKKTGKVTTTTKGCPTCPH